MKHSFVKSRHISMLTASLLASAASLTSTCAMSADTTPSEASMLEEIVITAQRREENLQRTAISATAFSGDALGDKAVSNMTDLQNAAPSLTITDNQLTQSVNIRGIGLASGSPQVNNGVAYYYDNLFQPPIVGTGTYYDLRDVEVLRGPQGTFVGSNSTGGAVFVNTKSPKLGESEGYGELTLGNYAYRGLQGALNIPFNNELAVRFAGSVVKRDSFFTDTGPLNNDAGKLDEKSGRASGRFANDLVDVTLKVEGMVRDTSGFAARPIPGTPFAGLRTNDIRTIDYDSPVKNHQNSFQTGLEMKFNLPGDITLRSMSGYQLKKEWNLYDLDASNSNVAPIPQFTEDQYVRERVYSQEFNLLSPSGETIDWVVGTYYQQNKINVDLALLVPGPQNVLINTNKITRGVFAQVGVKLTDTLKLDTGIRYSNYTVGSIGSLEQPGSVPPIIDLSGAHHDGRPTGKISLNWELTPDDLLFGFVTRGYKAGGFNNTTPLDPNLEFKTETVMDYELGWKSSWLNHTVNTQVSGFWMKYNNFQQDVTTPFTGQRIVNNLADGTVKGIELSAQASLNNWGMDAAYSYVKSELGSLSFINYRLLGPSGTGTPQCGLPYAPPSPICTDYSSLYVSSDGKPMLFSPENTFNMGVDYTFQLAEKSSLRPRINFSYVSSQWAYLTYDPVVDYIPSHQLWSASLTYKLNSWTVEAFGTNLANKEYVIGQFGNNETYGRPREYGVKASFTF